ncbi:chitin synthase [Sodiomyces alkalinus F11]|uniref:chitin synthase n=1 Tax=Sodiomyces alkalinus (strain CBS 110278 / VKM F-3762 / F11) TaxID=1314773 RepID=A0A3N2PW69_SODAK|nr:chitin synthase [Sodiomyces alkalinus F11]ROT38740.1 chitin synthase [Sodiomyces alkalinus F11]
MPHSSATSHLAYYGSHGSYPIKTTIWEEEDDYKWDGTVSSHSAEFWIIVEAGGRYRVLHRVPAQETTVGQSNRRTVELGTGVTGRHPKVLVPVHPSLSGPLSMKYTRKYERFISSTRYLLRTKELRGLLRDPLDGAHPSAFSRLGYEVVCTNRPIMAVILVRLDFDPPGWHVVWGVLFGFWFTPSIPPALTFSKPSPLRESILLSSLPSLQLPSSFSDCLIRFGVHVNVNSTSNLEQRSRSNSSYHTPYSGHHGRPALDMANSRMSMYSVGSEMPAGSSRGIGQQPSQVSTTSLLNSIHNIYLSSQPYPLDAGTSVVVNTWLTAAQPGHDGRAGGTVDSSLGAKAWEHARRRAEDGCIILGSLHASTPSVLTPFIASLPFSAPSSLYNALSAIQPFLRCSTPYNPSTPRQVALGVTFTLNLAGNLKTASVSLAQGGIDTAKGLLNIPPEAGYRAFDVFYYLLTSASTPAEREFLGLKPASNYTLLARSGTYDPPPYLPTADDAASAEDFRTALKEIGIKGSAHRNLISTLAGLLNLGNGLDYGVDEDALDEICEDVGGLLGMEPEVLIKQCTTEDRTTLVGGLYESLVDWVLSKANQAIEAQMLRIRNGEETMDGRRGAQTPTSDAESEDTVCLTVLEVPDPALGKAAAMRGVFDDTAGINAEMIADGIELPSPGTSVAREMENAVAEVAPHLGIANSPASRENQYQLEKRETILEKVAHSCEDDGFVKQLLFPVPGEGIKLGSHGRIDLASLLVSSRVWYHLSLHPTDDSPQSLAALPSVTSAWSAGTVSRQLRAWRLPEWANRRNKNLDFTADFDVEEFVQRYSILGCKDGRDGIESWILERGWSNGEVIVGRERVWMREAAWWEAESMLDLKPNDGGFPGMGMGMESGYSAAGSSYFPPQGMDGGPFNGSNDQLVHHQRNLSQGNMSQATFHVNPNANGLSAPSIAPTAMTGMRNTVRGDYGLGRKGDTRKDQVYYNEDGEFVGQLDPELAHNKSIEEHEMTRARRIWVVIVWALTFWIPSPLLRYVGRMKRPDVRMAWREKLVLCFFIVLLNGIIVFWIIGLGRVLCPNFDKAYSQREVATHTGTNDFWVSIHGKVYDITRFYRLQHSDIDIPTTTDNMMPFAGMNLDDYFVAPLPLTCPGLGIPETTRLMQNNTPEYPTGVHTSGFYQANPTSQLYRDDWYTRRFRPRIKEYFKGDLVWSRNEVRREGQNNRMWVLYHGSIYDLTDYFYTLRLLRNERSMQFLDTKLTSIVRNNPGSDVTQLWDDVIASSARNATENRSVLNSLNCIQNTFYKGVTDFRDSPRCTVNNYILLAFAIILVIVILAKFLAALQFGSKRRPAPQDKFVICQVPAYTEGEDSLRKALDSLTALQYDNKRKLICVICDGIIVGQGNDRPTPKIVLDILGVDPKVDPPALPFKSVGTGSEQLNYGKVYSGLYEFEGNIVPYVVVVKVGKESEQSKTKPGNRGKRDSQILLMSFLNRVHHRAPMNPLELEMFHQINNIIGVDPELYEYLLMVDADTCVREDSLNRLVAACANDGKIAGICGETGLQNDEKTWWTMIQVYEYFISHHLAKAFESLFGSVTCLPGCFTMYRLRSADKQKPLIISDDVIREYSVCDVDTLHKKNLLSLGEDRYLTTLMTKHFPYMSYKFIPDAYCETAAPESWSVLLSQRRRWINSTIHNLFELMQLKQMCGFCCFSMRFVVFIDLFGTIILPATCAYIGYLIYLVASRTGQFPIISIAMLAAVYGLQALIFILKRQWQHIGWMIIYIIAFPIYSFVLPVYSFWNQDNFSWGNTRIVIGEKGRKQVVAVDDEGFDPRSIPLQRWDDYALANHLPGRRGGGFPEKYDGGFDDQYEMDEIKSVYSSVRQGSVVMGLHNRPTTYMPPHSPAPFPGGGSPGHLTRQSTMTNAGPFADPQHLNLSRRQSMLSVGLNRPGDLQRTQSPFADVPSPQLGGASSFHRASMGNLRGQASSNPSSSFLGGASRSSTALGLGYAAGGSGNASRASVLGAEASSGSFDFQRGAGAGPDDGVIAEAIQSVLREVDLDTVTKKQVRALVEQRLQTELVGERRTFMDRQIDNELANM